MKIIYKDGHVDECPQDQELHVIRHTAAHIMAQAIKRLYPQADFAFGPATENGFYYDVDLGDQKLSDEDLANIEKEMRKIVKENLPIKPFILPRAEAVKLMEERKENYKIEHMADLADETEFSFFQQGEYVDMCIGPHLTYTKDIIFSFQTNLQIWLSIIPYFPGLFPCQVLCLLNLFPYFSFSHKKP